MKKSRKKVFALFLSLGILLSIVSAAVAKTESRISKALDYLHAHQANDGGFYEDGESSSEFLSCYAVLAISAAGEDPKDWKKNGRSPVDFIKGHRTSWKSITDYERAALALSAGGENSGGTITDLSNGITDEIKADGSIGGAVNSTCWGIFALMAAKRKISSAPKTIEFLRNSQNADGGWSWAVGGASDTNDTAVAIQAMRALGVGVGDSSLKRALYFLRKNQNGDGGYSFDKFASDSASDAWVLQSLSALSFEPEKMKKNGKTILNHLRSLQRENGGFSYQSNNDRKPVWMTCQAIWGLTGKSFPITKGLRRPASFSPIINEIFPASGGTTSSGRISISFSDGSGTGVERSGIELSVDGKSSFSKFSFSPGKIEAYLPLSVGSHTVQLVLNDRSGNRTVKKWSFEKRTGPLPSTLTAKREKREKTATGGFSSVSSALSQKIVRQTSAFSSKLIQQTVPADLKSIVREKKLQSSAPSSEKPLQHYFIGALTVFLAALAAIRFKFGGKN